MCHLYTISKILKSQAQSPQSVWRAQNILCSILRLEKKYSSNKAIRKARAGPETI